MTGGLTTDLTTDPINTDTSMYGGDLDQGGAGDGITNYEYTPEETAEIVGMGTLKLLEAARNICPEAKFYQASSSNVPTTPLSLYKAKLRALWSF